VDQNVEGSAGFRYEMSDLFIVLRYCYNSDNRFHEVFIRTVNTCVLFTSNKVEILNDIILS